jgi:hypothetical protein
MSHDVEYTEAEVKEHVRRKLLEKMRPERVILLGRGNRAMRRKSRALARKRHKRRGPCRVAATEDAK